MVAGAPAGRAVRDRADRHRRRGLLALLPRLALPRRLRPRSRRAITVAMLSPASRRSGLSLRCLLPGALGRARRRPRPGPRRAPHGRLALRRARTPGSRLTILLGAPLLADRWPPASPSGPRRRCRGFWRAEALVALARALRRRRHRATIPARRSARGFVLLLLVAAWLWLPRLEPARRAGGRRPPCRWPGSWRCPLAAALDGDAPWSTTGTGLVRRAARASASTGTTRYGPLDWPRDGHHAAERQVATSRHYWKAETLDRFDGVRWLRVGSRDRVADLPRRSSRAAPLDYAECNPRWDRASVTVRAPRSDLVVARGRCYRRRRARDRGRPPTTARRQALDEPLEKGDSYSVDGLRARPQRRRRCAAPRRYSGAAPLHRARPAARQATPQVAGMPLRGATALPRHVRQVRRTPPAGASACSLALRARLRARAPAHRRPADHLRRRDARSSATSSATTSTASARRPRRYPLAAFLFRDRVGYCQQFSGAMALMLRMVGIPARVAAGFTPGSYNTRHEGVPRPRPRRPLLGRGLVHRASAGFRSTRRRRVAPAELAVERRAACAARGARRPTAARRRRQALAPGGASGAAARPAAATAADGLVAGSRRARVVVALGARGWRRAACARSARAPPLPDDAAEAQLRELASRAARGSADACPARTTLRAARAPPRGAPPGRPPPRYVRVLRERRYGARAPDAPDARRAARPPARARARAASGGCAPASRSAGAACRAAV